MRERTKLDAYVNGRWVERTSLALPLEDPGALWGAAVVDRVRTYGGVLFRLDDHLARFRRSGLLCRIPPALDDGALRGIVAEAAARCRGDAERDVVVIMLATPRTCCVVAEPLEPDRYRSLFAEGARLVTPSTRHVPADCIPRQAKMRSRMFWWIAEQEAQAIEAGAAALLLDHRGFVTETATANLLAVHDGVVLSPPLADILPGVTRQVVRELCAALGIPFQERPLTVMDCLQADELLLTSTPFGVAGVARLNGQSVPWPGPMLLRLRGHWPAQPENSG
jgi:branched-chain amino acid aminotransferase